MLYDPVDAKVYPGGLPLEITKARAKCMSCMGAIFHHYYLQDINNDGLVDIGVVKSEVRCNNNETTKSPRLSVSQEINEHRGPMNWYLQTNIKWKLSHKKYNLANINIYELPLIEINMSPIEYALQRNRHFNEHDKGKLSIRANEPEVNVLVDGKSIGLAPIFNYPIDVGRHKITLIIKGGRQREYDVVVEKDEVIKIIEPYK